MRLACGVSILMAMVAQVVCADGLRIVPQRQWPEKGVVSPDGKFWAAVSAKRVFLIEVKEGALVHCEALEGARSVAFSNNGAYLAACGELGGLMIDLRDGRVRKSESLRGGLLVFGVDSKSLVVVRSQARPENRPEGVGFEFGRVGPAQEVAVLDLDLNQKCVFPSKVPHPLRLTLSPDGESLNIAGFHGDPRMHVPRLGRVEERMDLRNGKTRLSIEPPQRDGHAEFVQAHETLPKMDVKKRTAQTVQSFFWDDASGQCVLYGGGRPEGGVVKAWDVRNVRLSRHLGTHNAFEPHGFRGAGQLCGSTWIDATKYLVGVDLQTGEMTRHGKFAESAIPSPDGKHVAVTIPYSSAEASGESVEIRDESGVAILTETRVSRVVPGYWSSKGRYHLRIAEDRLSVHCLDLQTGEKRRFTLADVYTPPDNDARETHVWCYAIDPDETRIALGVGGARSGGAVVLDIASGEVLTVIDGQASWVSALRFVSKDDLALASRLGGVVLYSLAEKKNRWSREIPEVTQFGSIDGGEFLVCQNLFGAAKILLVSDGATIRSTPAQTSFGSSEGTPWTHPTLIGDGTYALEVDFDLFSIRLVYTRSGDTVLTYTALPEDQWIIHAPNGMWKGSERVDEYVRFYQGMHRLNKADTIRWSDPEGLKNIARILN